MAKRIMTKEIFDLIVQAYREQPENASHAARLAGVDRRTATKAFEVGCPGKTWGRPIKDILAEEKEQARLEKVRLAEAERKAAAGDRNKIKQDAIKANAEEALAGNISRANAIGFSRIVSKIVLITQNVVKELEKMFADPNQLAKMSAKEMMRIISQVAYIVQKGEETVKMAMEIERLRVGNPLSVLAGNVENLSTEEAVKELENLSKTLERAKARGLTVIAGGVGTNLAEKIDDIPEEE